MSEPVPPSRGKIPSRLIASVRRLHWKDVVIGVLALLFVSMSGYAFRVPLAKALARLRAGSGGETVSVFNVVVDRDSREYFDVLFDKPLGQGRIGEVLDPAPAKIEPALGGSWKWQTTNALRFQPSGGLPVASEYKVTLDPAKVVHEGQVFSGDTELTVKTDKFLVEEVTVAEEPALEGKAKVVYRGEMRFNYPVEPTTLAPLVKVVDPEEPKPIGVKLEVDYRAKVIGYSTEPVQKKKEERKIRLTIASSLTPARGNAPLGEEYVKEIEVGSSTKLSVRNVESVPGPRESTVKVTFSSPVSAAVAEKYVKIDPAVPVRLAAERDELSITGELEPGSTYALSIGKGMPATDEAVLQEDFHQEIVLPDLDPSVSFQSQGMFLWNQGQHAVALEAVNLPQVKMTIDRVYLNNLFFLFQYGGFLDEEDEYGYDGELNHALGDRLKEVNLDVGGRKNKKRVYPLDLDKYVNTKEPGLYRVSVGKPDDSEAKQRWLLLTDLGAVAKRGPGQFLVWVSSIKDLSPVADARVTLISDQNQTLASGRTDGSGVWRTDDAKAVAKGTPYMVTIEKGNDFSFLLLSSMTVDTTGLDVGGAEPPGEGYQAFLYGERDLYRPGEKLQGLAIVRDGALHIPPSMPALLRHRDPQGRELEVRKVTTGDKGLSPFELDLPAYSPTGPHTLELEVAQKVIGQYRFQVEEFVPDRISVAIVPPKEKVGPGQTLAYQVQSSYLFGAPAAGLPVESRVRLVDSTFAPKGFEGFSFRNDDRKLQDKEVLSIDDGKLDDEGHSDFKVEMPAGAPVPSSLAAVITARVQEQGGRGVAAMQKLQVDPYPYYVGLRRAGGADGEGFANPGKPAGFNFVVVSPEGKEVPAKALRADLFEDRWNTVLRKTPSGGWRYETTRDPRLVSSQAIPSGQSRGSFQVVPPTYGSYRVVLTDADTQASAEVEFYAAGWGTSPWAIKNPARLELDLDKPEYTAGETAVVQVRAPFSGKLLLTVERDKVLDTKIYDLQGNTAKIEIPVRADYRPNAYVTATLIRPVGALEPGSAGRAFGAVPISVNRTANHLAPKITAPDQMRPGRDLPITIKAAPNAVVTVAAVDEGILQLIAQKTPEPFDFFYRKLALGVISYDTFSLLLPELKSLTPGGGEGAEAGQYVRTEGIRRVQPVAFWSGPLTADKNGNAKVSFKVPEFQGALRIMAVAIENDRFGSSFRLTRVRDPLVLLPTLPRILSFGETLQVPVTVRNDTPKPGTIQVGLTAQGAVQIEKATQAIDIPVGRERTVYFTVHTGNTEGNVTFVATASGNGEQSKSTTEVSMRPDLPPASTEDAGAVGGSSVEIAGKDLDKYRPETLRRVVRVSPIPIVQFAGKLEDLLHYPYGCLEQTTSSAFPLLYIGDIAKALDPALLDPKKGHADPATLVQAGIRRIATMQLPGGGFSLWQGGQTVHLWGSVYATHFLVEARRAGHPVEDNLYRNALTWLAGEVKAKGTYGSEELERTVYGLYVLARAGKADLGTMDFLRQKETKNLSPDSRALLAAAYASAGNPRATQSLAANLGDVPDMPRQTGGNFDSAIRNRALLLLALMDADPKSPKIPALVDRLARDAKTDFWWTTQEESFTLLALGQFLQHQAKQPPYSGTLFVGGKKVGTFGNQTITFPAVLGGGPIRLQMDAGYKPGAAFYSVMTRGVVKDDSFQPESHGMEIQRELLDRDGKAISLDSVRQGDLIAIKTKVRSVSGPIQNVVIVNLLPSGLEVENPRLQSTEQLPWVTDANLQPQSMDLRDDRILLFADLPADTWQTFYTLVRAVAPGQFRLPPVQVEAMYNPAIRATGERGRMEVKVR